ncbi:OVCH2 [Lepeophtheirus salmonis]|uniref:OVCH2 n=1 Tax=Lepeophtheirus salmonis TaxID=72036 RepID=A0A7R8CLG5_LEPSM|nr:OVCH2 [Lepeophtheirus salmonis]CAF2853736.1 OVCH2 [Lepeophtheirus salmonis]
MSQGKIRDTKRHNQVGSHSIPNREKLTVSYKSLKDQVRIIGGVTSSIPVGVPSLQQEWFLTAGHCLYFKKSYNYSAKQIQVVVGEHDLSQESNLEQKRPVSKIFIHEAWIKSQESDSMTSAGDIAILLLDWPFKFNRYVQPVKMSDFSIQSGDRCVVAGWGILENKSKEPKDLGSNILDTNICAGKELNKDSCTGDSGGPLYCLNDEHKVFIGGVVSWGLASCGTGKPGVYTNVGLYIDWIMNTLNKYFKKRKEVGNLPNPLKNQEYLMNKADHGKFGSSHKDSSTKVQSDNNHRSNPESKVGNELNLKEMYIESEEGFRYLELIKKTLEEYTRISKRSWEFKGKKIRENLNGDSDNGRKENLVNDFTSTRKSRKLKLNLKKKKEEKLHQEKEKKLPIIQNIYIRE